jgi:hypothetical protein
MSEPSQVETEYARLTDHFLRRPGVTRDGRGFGSSALKVDGRIFAMLTSRSEFVVKLPKQRVDALVQRGEGVPYDAGKGRPMKEWVIIPWGSPVEWASIAEEALAFVGAPARSSR